MPSLADGSTARRMVWRVHLRPVAPPKRKTTGGRVTQKTGMNPSIPTTGTHAVGSRAGEVKNSSRYTAPHAQRWDESPRWVPIVMAVLLISGVVVILSRYFGWDSQAPTVIGLALLLGGLFVATKWK
jgi:Cell division protein CrgA